LDSFLKVSYRIDLFGESLDVCIAFNEHFAVYVCVYLPILDFKGQYFWKDLTLLRKYVTILVVLLNSYAQIPIEHFFRATRMFDYEFCERYIL